MKANMQYILITEVNKVLLKNSLKCFHLSRVMYLNISVILCLFWNPTDIAIKLALNDPVFTPLLKYSFKHKIIITKIP